MRWKTYQGRLDPRKLVVIDEAGAKANMTSLPSWCRRSDKLVVKASFGKWKTLTFVAALRYDRIDAPCVLDGSINGELFLVYVEQFPMPTLSPRQHRHQGKLGSHQGQVARKAIRATGAKLLFCIATISVRSNWSSPNSSCSCAKPPNLLSKPLGSASATARYLSTSQIRQLPQDSGYAFI